jgi:general secretion pathway protein D
MKHIGFSILLSLALAAPLLAQSSNRPSTPGFNNSTTPYSSTGRMSSSSAGGGGGGGGGNSATARQYRNNTMLGDAIVQIDPETRSVIVVADDDTQNEVFKVISSLDRPKPQVLIKVLFAQVTLDKDLNFGVEGNYSFNIGPSPMSQVLSGLAQTATSTLTTAVVTGTGGSTTQSTSTPSLTTLVPPISGASTAFGLAQQTTGAFFRVNTNSATETLYALAQKGDVNVLSRPSILARNNQEAVIVVGQEVPFITNSQITEAGQTINTVNYQDVGIILRVTPFISQNRTVEMIVSPEISSLSSQTVPISPTVNAPVINKTSAETVVVTPDATTVVIGGMMQKQQLSSIDKVPILGDIPLLGQAFRHTVKSDQKTELLIFLTPYIVEGTQPLKDLSEQEMNRTDLPDTAPFQANDIDKYLDTLHPVASPTPKPKPHRRGWFSGGGSTSSTPSPTPQLELNGHQ